MRRTLSWSRSAGRKAWVTGAVVTALLPGLLLFQAVPVTAAVQAVTSIQGSPDSPKQLTGSANGLPSMASTEATSADIKLAKRDPKPPKGALPPESRHKFTDEPATGGLKSPPPLPGKKDRDDKVAETTAFSDGEALWSTSESPAMEDAEVPSSAEQPSRVGAAESVPSVSNVRMNPGTLSSGVWVASTLTPYLEALPADPGGRDVRVSAEVEHDPAAPAGQGSGYIWSGTSTYFNPPGYPVSVQIPAGELTDGWLVRWRVRGVTDGSGVVGPWSAWQSMRVDVHKPSVSNLVMSPGTLSSGVWVASTLTPSFSAKVTDPAGRSVKVSAEVEHDPAAPAGQGSGYIWSGTSTYFNPSGNPVSVQIPAGRLTDGWLVRWRVRGAIDGSGVVGPWSAWQSMRVDVHKPSVSNVRMNPGTLSSGVWVASTLTPYLEALPADPGGRDVRVSAEVEHDPAAPAGQGSGYIWSGTSTYYNPPGYPVSVQIPAGELTNGWLVRWRVRGVTDGSGVVGPWSAWQSMKIDVLPWQWASPEDNTQVGSLRPTLAAYAKPSASSMPVSYWFQLCKGTPQRWDWCESSPSWSNAWSWQVPAGKLKWGETYSWYVQASTSLATVTSPWRTFTTSPEQGTINSLLASGTNGRDFDHVSGNYTQSVTDATVAAAGLPLSVTRTYNSLDPRADGAFGAGWSTRWDMRVLPEPHTATLLLTYPDGRQLRFAAKGDGTYVPPPGTHATLAEVTGGGWRLMDTSSTSYWFDNAGRLTKVSDRRGRTQDLVYGTDGKLAKVTAPGGRSLTFTWTGNHVSTVSTDPLDGAALTWTYTYTGDALTKVCAPGAGTACTVYAYTSASRYRSVMTNAAPTGYWRLGEATTKLGDKIVSSADWNAGDADATLAGASYNVSPATPGALAGSGDGAMRFAGTATSTYVQLPSGAINGRGGLLAVEAWFKTTGSGTVIGYQNSLQSNFTPAVYVGTDGKLRGQFYTGKTEPITSAAAVNDGAWHHVVLSGAENTQTLFLDGQVVGTLSGEITHLDQGEARLGYGYASPSWPATVTTAGAFPFTGDLDEVAVYGKPLGLAEVRTHYAARLAQPQMTTATLPSGRVRASNTFAADGGRLLTHTDHNGGTWKLGALQYAKTGTENGVNASTVVTDPRNDTLSYVSDATRNHRMVSQTDQLEKVTSYAYDTAGNPAKITDRNGNVTELSHNERGNLISQRTCRTAGSCNTTYFTYHVNEDNPFDPRNDQLTVSRDARSSSATDNTYATKITYTEFGEPAKQTTPATADFPDGRSTSTTYTDGTEAAVGGGNTPAGLVKSEKNAKGEESTYRYTAAGDLAEQRTPSGLVITSVRDALGRVTSRTETSAAHPDGVTLTFTYDGLGRVLTQTGAGVKNEVTGVTHTAKTTSTYDADGNALTQSLTDLTGGDPARTTTSTYDAHGRLETVTDPEGGVVRSTWDVTGARTSTTDPLGTVLTFGYTERGEPASTTLKNWTGSPVSPQAPQDVVLESKSYDPAGRLASQVDAMGRKTSYTYFADNKLSQVMADDARLNGSTTTEDVVLEDNTYDAAGNLIKQVTGGMKATDNKAITENVYDAAGRLTSTTFDPAALKRKTAYTYDAAGNVTKKDLTGAGSTRVESTTYAYNPLGQVTRQTVENGADDLVSTSTYDERGLLITTTDPRGNATGATAADFTTTMRYDNAGRLIETTAPQVKVDKAGSTTESRPTVKQGYNTIGLVTQAVDAEGRTITSAFDKAGRLTSTTAPAYTPPGTTTLIPTTSYDYDAAGRQISVTDPRGYVTSTTYDALSRPVRETAPGPDGPGGQWVSTYDLLGEPLAVIDPTGARVEATYDDLGRTITTTQIERKPTTAALTTKLTYDSAGNLITSVAPGDKTTSYTVNAAGQVTAVTDPNLNKTSIGYDVLGRQTKVTNPLENVTEIEYDLAGRQIAAKDLTRTGAVVRTLGVGYDPAGNPTSTTSGEGHITRQQFDALGRMTALIEPVSTNKSITSTFGYDATGARTRTTDGRGNTTWTSYNTLGLVESVIEPATAAHPSAADRTWTTLYDAAGNATSSLQPGGVRIDRTFDPLGQVVKETGTGASVTTPERTVSYDQAGRVTAIGDYSLEYNDRGLLTKASKATNQIAAYTYDALGNPTQRIDATGMANYTWDAASRLKTAGDPVTGRTFTYDYDKADNLLSKTSANPVNAQAYTYDAANRLTSQTLKNSSGSELSKIAYGWDKDDNLTSKTTSGTAGAGTNSYGYDHAGRLTSWTAPGGASTAYGWDDAGNRTSAGSKTFTYDERNRLTSGAGVDYTYTPRGTTATETKAGVTKNLTFDAFDRMIIDGEASYGYDALGRVTSRTQGATQQRFVYSGLDNDIVTVTDAAGATQAKYGRDLSGGLLSLQEGTGPALGVMADLHGDVVATFSGTALVDSTAYDPFGEVTHRSGTQRTLGYQGEYTDPDTGKVNMNARWYQPGTGAFASRDTVTLDPNPSVQANRYTYANAAPLTGIDPTGHSWLATAPSISLSDPYAVNSGYICSSGMCFETDARARWWADYTTAPGYDYENRPHLSDDEIERLGFEYMPNGRPVPKRTDDQVIDFWYANEEAQNDYMSKYAPIHSDKTLSILWAVTAAYHNQYPVKDPGDCVEHGQGCAEGVYSKSVKDGRTAMHRAADEFARQWAKVKGPTWRDIDGLRYATLKKTISEEKAREQVMNFKERWVKGYKDVISAAAAYFGVPAWILAGIAFNEVGGDPPAIDDLALQARYMFQGKAEAMATSLGPVSMQIGLAAQILGYKYENVNTLDMQAIVRTLKNPASNLFIVASYISTLRSQMGGGYLGDGEATWIAAVYNGGREHWDSIKAQRYARDFMAAKPIVVGILGGTR
ncbi:RHS repeat-associated core domain-containing protein [Streptosporangium lutulentum]|uniref:RHS repeat-associated core domain-containing protein n=1 Tax=Streptosporangium lutulentum TaxID=1461250 RepID=UPI00363AA506